MESRIPPACYLMDHVANKCEAPVFTCKRKALPSSLQLLLKNSILQRETFSSAVFSVLILLKRWDMLKRKTEGPTTHFKWKESQYSDQTHLCPQVLHQWRQLYAILQVPKMVICPPHVTNLPVPGAGPASLSYAFLPSLVAQ